MGSSDAQSQSDDEAPEELSLATGKSQAQQQKRLELSSVARVNKEAKEKRRLESKRQNAQDLDLLPHDVVAAVASKLRPSTTSARSVVQQQQQQQRQKRKRVEEVKKGPVVVRVLGEGAARSKPSEAATRFMKEQLFGGRTKRSQDMLHSTGFRTEPAVRFVS